MKLKDIRIIFTDVDGVLTDGRLIVSNNGVYHKSFSVKDGMGVNIAKRNGIKIVWVTGRKDNSTELRSKELNCECIFTESDKKDIVISILKREGLDKNNAVYIGDDINDITVKDTVLYFFSPRNAHRSILEISDKVIDKDGGDGVLREVVDLCINE